MHNNKLIEQVGANISQGKPSAYNKAQQQAPLNTEQKQALTNAINQLFAELELTYHNQYLKAFSSADKLGYAKKLWFDYLKGFAPDRILLACRKATRESEYLPTIHTLIKYCEVSTGELGLPDTYQAYIEACQAPSPKTEYSWSHPAVYWAGKASDWFFLSSNIEAKTLPVFKRHYEALCERIKKGETLAPPEHLALPNDKAKPLSSEQKRERLAQLRKEIKL
ncbi:replication protein P [Dasania marina]|uniref:replication protein P n=1 Tax=Dasania marina TaxID=471499 RepID=UPI0030DB3269|tara:strand:+ start:82611 stop:83279 length:669 start_codon:yes stop_codon:yes gene_type:complete